MNTVYSSNKRKEQYVNFKRKLQLKFFRGTYYKVKHLKRFTTYCSDVKVEVQIWTEKNI